MIRAILAGALGWLLFAASAAALFLFSERDPHATPTAGFAVFSVLYGMAFALIGGTLAGRLGGARRQTSARTIAALLVAGATISLVTQPGYWSQLSAMLLMAPCAYFAATRAAGPRSRG